MGKVSKIYCHRRAVVKALVCRGKAGNNDFVGSDSGELSNDSRRKKLAVFVSGGGSNFRAIHEATERGLVNRGVTVFVTDKPGYAFPRRSSVPEGLSASDLVTSLRTNEIYFILLASYLKLIPVELGQAYPKSIINIHPSLLPAFGGKGYYGIKVHKAVIASGARYSGLTIHFVDEHYDTGRILAQRVVPGMANDSTEELAARILHEEHKVYVEVVAALCEGRIIWREDGVPVIQSK